MHKNINTSKNKWKINKQTTKKGSNNAGGSGGGGAEAPGASCGGTGSNSGGSGQSQPFLQSANQFVAVTFTCAGNAGTLFNQSILCQYDTKGGGGG